MVNYEQVQNQLRISYINTNGNISIETLTIPESERFNWGYCSESDKNKDLRFRSHDNLPVKKIPAKTLNKYRVIEFINANTTNEFKSRIFADNQPKKAFIDIETQAEFGVPKTSNPISEIRSNAILLDHKQLLIQSLKPLTGTQKEKICHKIHEYLSNPKNYRKGFKPIDIKFDIKFKCYDYNEKSMIQDFFYNYYKKLPFVSGWNVLRFDIAYLNARGKFLGVDITRASNGSKTKENLNKMYNYSPPEKNKKKIRTVIELPLHKITVDYLDVFVKYDTSVKVKENNKLDSIAYEVLGIQKYKYNDSLDVLYENDIVSYLTYNAVDSILTSAIDQKLKTINTMMKICNKSGCQFIETMFTSVVIESIASKLHYNQNQVIIEKPYKERSGGKKYSGGWVLEPKPGYFENVFVMDFRAMFPSIICYGNIGIDTLVGEFINDDEIKTIDGKIIKYDKNLHTKLEPNVAYRKDRDSVLRSAIGYMLQGRIDAKLLGKELESEIEMLERLKQNLN